MELIIGDKDPVNKTLWIEDLAIRDTSGGTFNTSELPASATWLLKGAPCYMNDTTGAVNAVKSMKVVAGGTTTIPFVEKNHLFVVGDFVFRTVGGLAVTINSIDTTTSATHDIVTLSAALTGTVADDILMQSVAAGASAGALKYVPNGLIYANVKIDASPSVAVVINILSKIQRANLPFYLNEVQITELNKVQNFYFV